jgi:uncharacterized protein YegP (UPF0339 family)
MGRYEIVASADGFRWRFFTPAGVLLCTCAETFSSREECRAAIEWLKGSWAAAVVEAGEAAKERRGEGR